MFQSNTKYALVALFFLAAGAFGQTVSLLKGPNLVANPMSDITNAETFRARLGANFVVRTVKGADGFSHWEPYIPGLNSAFPMTASSTAAYLVMSPAERTMSLTAPPPSSNLSLCLFDSSSSAVVFVGSDGSTHASRTLSFNPTPNGQDKATDGRYVYYFTGTENTLYGFDLTSGNCMLVSTETRTESPVDTSLTYNPYFNELAFLQRIRDSGGTLRYVVATMDASTHAMTSQQVVGDQIYSPKWRGSNNAYSLYALTKDSRLIRVYPLLGPTLTPSSIPNGIQSYDISEDQRNIVFTPKPAFVSGFTQRDVWYEQGDGGGVMQLIHNSVDDYNAVIQPGNSGITFQSDRTGIGFIYTMNMNGNFPRLLTQWSGVPQYVRTPTAGKRKR